MFSDSLERAANSGAETKTGASSEAEKSTTARKTRQEDKPEKQADTTALNASAPDASGQPDAASVAIPISPVAQQPVIPAPALDGPQGSATATLPGMSGTVLPRQQAEQQPGAQLPDALHTALQQPLGTAAIAAQPLNGDGTSSGQQSTTAAADRAAAPGIGGAGAAAGVHSASALKPVQALPGQVPPGGPQHGAQAHTDHAKETTGSAQAPSSNAGTNVHGSGQSSTAASAGTLGQGASFAVNAGALPAPALTNGGGSSAGSSAAGQVSGIGSGAVQGAAKEDNKGASQDGSASGGSASGDSGNAAGATQSPAGQAVVADEKSMAVQAIAAPAQGAQIATAAGHGMGSDAAAQKPAPAGSAKDSVSAGVLKSDEGAALPAVNTSRVLQSMGQTEMRVGMHSPEFGAISISTSLSRQQLTAQISLDHADLGAALEAHMPGIQEKLGAAYGVQARVEVRDTGAQFTGGNPPQQDAAGGRQQRGDVPYARAGNSTSVSAVAPGTGMAAVGAREILSGNTARLSVHV